MSGRRVGSAMMLIMPGWNDRYQFAKDGKITLDGLYEDVFLLDGKAYISPYYTGFDDWVEMEPLEALNIIAVGVGNPSDRILADEQVQADG